MKTLYVGLTVAVLSLPLFAQAANVPEVKRIKNAAPNAPILAGVVVPAGNTLFYLSGQVPAVVDSTKPADSIDAYGNTKAPRTSSS
ncbi:MAG: hypothetical protein RLZZ450_4068 [Pseudomonadota bacterium]|jgi:hypothetical protein